MAADPLTPVLRHARQLAALPREHGATDAELLERFAAGHDAAAFEALLCRHGGLVWRVCRRVLPCTQDAEDAWQATFFCLARQAASIRKPGALANWLHGVAFRLAQKARAGAESRRAREQAAGRPAPDPAQESAWRELGRILEEEVAALPEKYRLPLLLCYWRGLTNEEAGHTLSWPAGTVKTRLARARELLHGRLTARGVTLPAGAGVLLLAPGEGAAAVVPAALAAATLQVVAALAAGKAAPASGVSVQVAELARAALPGAAVGKVKFAVVLALVLGAAALGAGLLVYPRPQERPPVEAAPPPAQSGQPNPAAGKPAATDLYGSPLPPGAVARIGSPRWWHGEPCHVLYAPDGKVIASTGADGQVRLWEPGTGKLLRRLEDGNKRIHLAAFSADGKLLATASYNESGKVRLWDVATGKAVREIQGHRREVSCLVFAPDSRTLAVGGSDDNALHLWDVATAGEVRALRGHRDQIQAAAFSPDGKTVATGGLDRTVRLWETASGEERRGLDDYRSPVHAVAFSPDGKRLAAGGGEDTGNAPRDVILWEAATGAEVRRLEGQPGPIRALAFLPDGKTVAARGNLGRVILWDAATGKQLPRGRAADPFAGLVSLSFAPDGKILASGNSAGHVVLWDVTSGRYAPPLPVNQGPLDLLAFGHDGKVVIGPQHVWDAVTGKELRRLPRRLDGGRVAVFAPDRKTVATLVRGKETAQLVLQDVAGGEVVRRFEPPLTDIGSLAFAPDGKLLASATRDGALDLWDTATGKQVRSLRAAQGWGEKLLSYNLHLGRVVVAFAPDGKSVAASGFSFASGRPQPTLGLWDVASGKHLRNFAGLGGVFIDYVAVAPDGKSLATGGLNGTPKIHVWEVASGKQLPGWSGKHEGALPLAFSPDGKTLATGGGADRKLVWLWEVSTGKELARFRGHEGPVLTLAFSPDGQALASGSRDNTGLIWNVGRLR
jgi:RNA polymerase sigma factor (sigma-70 family)